MSGFLLDTNVVSEIVSPAPEPRVIAFLTDHPDLWLSTIVLHEMSFGLDLLPLGRRRDRLSSALSALVAEYGDRILPVGRSEAEQAATLRAKARRSGRVLHLGDALIAGTAMDHGSPRRDAERHGLPRAGRRRHQPMGAAVTTIAESVAERGYSGLAGGWSRFQRLRKSLGPVQPITRN